ncbi:MAG: SH3 domain-containing protein, partial [Oscillospiraceae bacterium]|nr:SH3 domain-containing protein [Oscillospiraceae bacterium]
MKNKCCSLKRIVSLMILLAMLLSCAPAMAEGYSAVVNQSSVGVYSDAKMTKSAGTLSGYTVVTVLSVDGTVAKIRCGGFTLYTDLYALTKVSDFAIPAEFNAATFVFQDPDVTSRSVTVKAGMQVNVLAVSGNWAMIERNGYAGFTYKGYLTPVTTADDENAADPFLPQETPDNTIQGTNQVTIETISAVVSTTSLPVYKSASTSSSKLGTLKSGQAVTIHAYNDAWAYISLNGKYGFCKLAGLQKTGTIIVNPDNDINDVKSKPAKVTAESVVVYSKANTSSKNRLGTLKKGTVVNLVKTSTNWAYIELNGHYGYCALSALTVADEGTSNAGMTAMGTATVITPTAKVYTSASTNANYTTVPIGTTYSFYSYDSAWVMVGLSENNFAYIPISCLNAESYAELKNEDSGAAVTALQSALLALGYFDGVPSTNYAADTTAAVKRLQAACGMAQTG